MFTEFWSITVIIINYNSSLFNVSNVQYSATGGSGSIRLII